ncbi:indole-3-glycerol-phosphate synthase [Candidatus Peregrinibacteria bacterium]|nr:indole-3-glycerol-phosphate synthase [Candidatus Peregrinibacteria bacterium]
MNNFEKAIRGRDRISVIAELKRFSPSHGKFPEHDIEQLMKAYEKGGASAISVVTDAYLFKGSLELLREARRHTKLPIIRKDFLTKKEHIDASVEAGADAILLIARMLDEQQLQRLATYAHEKGLDTVIEIHDDEDFKKIAGITNTIIGINNRNLQTFTTNVRHAEKFLDRINPKFTIIAESAFSSAEEFAPYFGKIDAVLIGTALLTSENPSKALSSFIYANRP